ncbi:MAG: hypothetical protein R2797_00885 [Gelidibacter sp.]
MIDYIRAKLLDKDKITQKMIKDKDMYEVEGKYSYTIGELPYPIRSRRENLFINVTEKSAYIENSIHKYFNNLVSNENQNYNDFYLCDILYTLDVLEQEINYPLENTLVTNLEFGFNIELNINPTKFLQNHVLMHNLRTPCFNPKNDSNMKIKKFIYTEYEIKIYNKTLEQSRHKGFKSKLTGTNILRIEVKYTSKKQLSKLGINTLNDLKNPKSYHALIKDFMNRYDDLLIIDSYNGSSLMSKKDREFITLCTHPNHWIDIRTNSHSNTPTNHKKKLKKLIKEYELDTWKKHLKQDILNKFNQLMSLGCFESSKISLNVA